MSQSAPGLIRVLLVEDHVIVRQGLRLLIGSTAGMQIVGEAGNRREALELANREHPNVILLDLDLGGINALEFLPELLSVSGGAKVLVLTGVRDPEQHRRAVLLGAMGLVIKEQAGDVLVRAIEKVHAGEAWLDRSLTATVIARFSQPEKTDKESPKIASLTKREREIIEVVCEGLKNDEIARRLIISEATVRHHLTSILSKLEVSDRFELALYSYRNGLAKPPQK